MHGIVRKALAAQGCGPMLTGNQIAAARRLAGFNSQKAFAEVAGVSKPTVERAEGAGPALPNLKTEQMARIVQALEGAGVEFFLVPGASLVGGASIKRRTK
ncbi:helix-turn-helix domain-containing protein [Muricoccus nepalensis]|uniref:helix-turn-helix domain-containing protein n=1 Tax=Muricoccus nepalensis TaxID=1854500 RepID=UPI0011273AAC|nr:helix-turn-helix transcriptional regulator [Roseomonas nepalensis]